MKVFEHNGEYACEHGTALDVHCCNCHSGFLFDINSCVCEFEPQSPVARESKSDGSDSLVSDGENKL